MKLPNPWTKKLAASSIVGNMFNKKRHRPSRPRPSPAQARPRPSPVSPGPAQAHPGPAQAPAQAWPRPVWKSGNLVPNKKKIKSQNQNPCHPACCQLFCFMFVLLQKTRNDFPLGPGTVENKRTNEPPICYFSVLFALRIQPRLNTQQGRALVWCPPGRAPLLLCVEPWLNTQWQTENSICSWQRTGIYF